MMKSKVKPVKTNKTPKQNSTVAYTIFRKPNGYFSLRKLIIDDMNVIAVADVQECTQSDLMAKITLTFQGLMRSIVSKGTIDA